MIDDAAAIVNHQLEVNQVKLYRELGQDLPQIKGNANQLQQVVMNLMINAQQAMKGTSGLRGPRQTLRTVLHDQTHGRGHGTGPLGQLLDHPVVDD